MALSADGDVIAVDAARGEVGSSTPTRCRSAGPFRSCRRTIVTRLGFVPGGHLARGRRRDRRPRAARRRFRPRERLEGPQDVRAEPGSPPTDAARHGRGRRDRPALVAARRPPGMGPPLRFRTASTTRELSPDGRRLAVCCSTRPACPTRSRCETSRGPPPRSRPCRRQQQPVRFSPDGRLVAVGNNSGRAQVWSTTTWRPVSPTVAGHAGALSGAAISPARAHARHRRRRRHGPAVGRRDRRGPRSAAARRRQADGRAVLHGRRHATARLVRDGRRLSVGHPARVGWPTGLPRGRAPPHARGMATSSFGGREYDPAC